MNSMPCTNMKKCNNNNCPSKMEQKNMSLFAKTEKSMFECYHVIIVFYCESKQDFL